jgi:hypothetical protein
MPDWGPRLVSLSSLVPPTPDEAAFRRWYARLARRWDLNPDPDAPEQAYDYRGAWRAGATPDPTGHWPSDFKRAGHPNEIVGGFNTRTGERVPGAPLASGVDELIRLGWEPDTARRLWATVDTAPPPRKR